MHFHPNCSFFWILDQYTDDIKDISEVRDEAFLKEMHEVEEAAAREDERENGPPDSSPTGLRQTLSFIYVVDRK